MSGIAYSLKLAVKVALLLVLVVPKMFGLLRKSSSRNYDCTGSMLKLWNGVGESNRWKKNEDLRDRHQIKDLPSTCDVHASKKRRIGIFLANRNLKELNKIVVIKKPNRPKERLACISTRVPT